jgi:hypothetical protein
MFHYRALSGKNGQKMLKCAVGQRSGPFFMACVHGFSEIVAKFHCTTQNVGRILLSYAALTLQLL